MQRLYPEYDQSRDKPHIQDAEVHVSVVIQYSLYSNPDLHVIVPDHSPEVHHRVAQGSLSSNVVLVWCSTLHEAKTLVETLHTFLMQDHSCVYSLYPCKDPRNYQNN